MPVQIASYLKNNEESMAPQLNQPYGYVSTSQGLSLRYGHWRCPDSTPRGSVLVLQGRSEFMEKYQESIDELLLRRMDVFSFDWRGQGLSDRMLPEFEKGFVNHYDDYLEDLAHFLKNIVLPQRRGPLLMLSHSMGGHIGLRYLYQHEHEFQKAVFIAPMIDVKTGLIPDCFVRWLTRRQIAKGNDAKVVLGSSRSTPFPARFKGNRLTSDAQRFYRNLQMVKSCPRLSAAYVTYGWLAATHASIDRLKQSAIAQSLAIPLLFVRAGKDRIVSSRAIDQFAGALPHFRLVTIKNAQHEILQETDPQRQIFWKAFDDFLSS
jgi:lysophospholipase